MSMENWQAAWRQLIAPGSPFEVVAPDDDGPRCFRNAQPDLLTALNAGRAHGEREFVVWEDQRLSFAEFFAQVVKPYLANKLDKTFVDEWLLDRDLATYLEPWRFARLNTLERILLGGRIEGERDAMNRRIREQFELLPPQEDRDDMLFQTALLGRALEAASTSGLVDFGVKAEHGQSSNEHYFSRQLGRQFGEAMGGMGGMRGGSRGDRAVA